MLVGHKYFLYNFRLDCHQDQINYMAEFVRAAEGELLKLVFMLHHCANAVVDQSTPTTCTEEEARKVSTKGIAFAEERAAEKQRIDALAAGLKEQVSVLRHAIQQLCDEREDALDEELRQLNSKNVALGQKLIEVYDEAALLSRQVEEEVLTAVAVPI